MLSPFSDFWRRRLRAVLDVGNDAHRQNELFPAIRNVLDKQKCWEIVTKRTNNKSSYCQRMLMLRSWIRWIYSGFKPMWSCQTIVLLKAYSVYFFDILWRGKGFVQETTYKLYQTACLFLFVSIFGSFSISNRSNLLGKFFYLNFVVYVSIFFIFSYKRFEVHTLDRIDDRARLGTVPCILAGEPQSYSSEGVVAEESPTKHSIRVWRTP